MSKLDGVKTVVVGGFKDSTQHYCGTVGGQSTDFSTIDTEIKVADSIMLYTEVYVRPEYPSEESHPCSARLVRMTLYN